MADRACSKCGKENKLRHRNKHGEAAAPGIEKKESRQEDALCDACMKKFKTWMEKNGYDKSDCWCRHIDEFKGIDNA